MLKTSFNSLKNVLNEKAGQAKLQLYLKITGKPINYKANGNSYIYTERENKMPTSRKCGMVPKKILSPSIPHSSFRSTVQVHSSYMDDIFQWNWSKFILNLKPSEFLSTIPAYILLLHYEIYIIARIKWVYLLLQNYLSVSGEFLICWTFAKM